MENYGKTIRRNFVRGKTFSFINITGLAVGMASALLILLWIRHEMRAVSFVIAMGTVSYQSLQAALASEELGGGVSRRTAGGGMIFSSGLILTYKKTFYGKG